MCSRTGRVPQSEQFTTSSPLKFSQTKLYCCVLRQWMEPLHLLVRQYSCFSPLLLVLPVYVILLITLREFALGMSLHVTSGSLFGVTIQRRDGGHTLSFWAY